MAQAARLNLRMQKELKLLITDPPPGASFPLLDLSSFSFSTIDAQIEGPQGTVYANGLFKIKIQIPERYPFQPPIVTFVTPIYHPNIDNGGRICLDILNLPPKGAWQPSLNISTVLTSIGLLLSEPNPDDGLMREASKEYKYNKQVFDQKARSMTEKYAKAGASQNDRGSESNKSHSNSSTMESKGSKVEADEYFVSHKKSCGISRKLSLEYSESNPKSDSDISTKEVPIDHLLENQMDVKAPQHHQTEIFNEYKHQDLLVGSRRKLSLESRGPTQKRSDSGKENVVLNQSSSLLNPQNVSLSCPPSLLGLHDSIHYEQHSYQELHQDREFKSMNDGTNKSSKVLGDGQRQLLDTSGSDQRSDNSCENLHTKPHALPLESQFHVSNGSLPMPVATNRSEKQLEKDNVEGAGGFNKIKQNRLGLTGKRPYLGGLPSSKSLEEHNKENIATGPNVLLSHPPNGECYEGKAREFDTEVAPRKLRRIGQRVPREPLHQLQGSNSGNTQLHLQTSSAVAEESRKDEKQQYHGNDGCGGCMEQTGEGSPVPETVIVLDSEDSEEERDTTMRSKLSLARKRLRGKWNSKV